MDRLKIALYGYKDERQKQAEQVAKTDKTAERSQAETDRQYKNSHITKCKTKKTNGTFRGINTKLQEDTKLGDSLIVNNKHQASIETAPVQTRAMTSMQERRD